jgi:hypothetical protein
MAACVNCGAKLPKNARFCSACGAPQRGRPGTVQARPLAVAPEDAAEACAIHWWRGYVRSAFYAVAVDAGGGQWEVGRSPSFSWWKAEPPPAGHAGAHAAHDALVADLVERGWKTVGSDWQPWYAVRFRRPAMLRALAGGPDEPAGEPGARQGAQPGSDTASP